MEDIDKSTQKKYNKRAYTNEFETNAMIWAHSDKTHIGEQKLFYRKGKWVLLEKSDDGFVELASYTEKQRSEIAKEIEEYNENIREDLFTCIMRHETIGGHDIRANGDDGWKQTGNRRSGGVYQEESQSNRIGSDQSGEYDIRGNEKIKFDESSRFSIDDSYISAVERGDMKTAQRVVDEKAKNPDIRYAVEEAFTSPTIGNVAKSRFDEPKPKMKEDQGKLHFREG